MEERLKERLSRLREQLTRENPLLVDAVAGFQKLDRVCRGLGLLGRGESTISQIAWWPLISILGPFSAGKSTFINHYLGQVLQQTGAHAVDDKFTVICHSAEGESRILPGVALDADPRLPFYKMSEELEKVASGEGRRIDAYLRLKTCPGEKIKGLILIDSPGFDADAQRTATLRITSHIMDLSDLVLILFDARRPEPGAMRDTLTHLVSGTVNRPDSSKFVYILNQMDVAAREDNPEEVVGAWQRALAQHGLTAGKFYRVYNPEAASPIADEGLRRRFESKRDQDLAEIHGRMDQVRVERAYRIVGSLEKLAREVEDDVVPRLRAAKRRFVRLTLRYDMILAGLLAGAVVGAYFGFGYPSGGRFVPEWTLWLFEASWRWMAGLGLLAVAAGWLHLKSRKWATSKIITKIEREEPSGPARERFIRAFEKNAAPWRGLVFGEPVGWGRKARKLLKSVITDAEKYVQALNDRYARPSGQVPRPAGGEAAEGRPETTAGPAQDESGQTPRKKRK